MPAPAMFVELARARSMEQALPTPNAARQHISPRTNLLLRLGQFLLAMISMGALASTTTSGSRADQLTQTIGEIAFVDIQALNFLITMMALVFIWSFTSMILSALMLCDAGSPEFGWKAMWWHLLLDVVFGELSFAASAAAAGVMILLHRGVGNGPYGRICYSYAPFCMKSDVGTIFGFFTSFTTLFTAWLFSGPTIRRGY